MVGIDSRGALKMTNPELNAVCGRIRDLGLLAVLVFVAVSSGFAQTNSTAAQLVPGANGRLQLEGELEILNKDFKDHAQVSYSLKTSNGRRIPLRFAKEPPSHLLTGDHVRADGELSGGGLLLDTGTNLTTDSKTTSTATSSIPVPNTFGSQYTLVILVNFQDDAIQPYTVSDTQAMYSGSVN